MRLYNMTWGIKSLEMQLEYIGPKIIIKEVWNNVWCLQRLEFVLNQTEKFITIIKNSCWDLVGYIFHCSIVIVPWLVEQSQEHKWSPWPRSAFICICQKGWWWYTVLGTPCQTQWMILHLDIEFSKKIARYLGYYKKYISCI